MHKAFLAIPGSALLFGFCCYVSTQIGLRTEGWHPVVLELPGPPEFKAVGQTFPTPDGSKVLVTEVTRAHRGKHAIHAKVHGTHRYALAFFPTRWEHSFAMDRPSVEWTLRQAGGMPPAPLNQEAGRRWHVLQ